MTLESVGIIFSLWKLINRLVEKVLRHRLTTPDDEIFQRGTIRDDEIFLPVDDTRRQNFFNGWRYVAAVNVDLPA